MSREMLSTRYCHGVSMPVTHTYLRHAALSATRKRPTHGSRASDMDLLQLSAVNEQQLFEPRLQFCNLESSTTTNHEDGCYKGPVVNVQTLIILEPCINMTVSTLHGNHHDFWVLCAPPLIIAERTSTSTTSPMLANKKPTDVV